MSHDLTLPPPIPQWHEQALCAQADPEAWFPLKGERNDLARAICHRCPVQALCLQAGLDEQYGIWGGCTVKERQAIKHQHQHTNPDSDPSDPDTRPLAA